MPKRILLDTNIVIAAAALVYRVPLITKNVKDFRGIPDLKVQSTL